MVKILKVIIILKILANFIVHQKYDTLNVEQLQKYDEKKKKKIRKA